MNALIKISKGVSSEKSTSILLEFGEFTAISKFIRKACLVNIWFLCSGDMHLTNRELPVVSPPLS